MNTFTIGTTFSQLQCAYMHLDYKETLTNILSLPFLVIRVSAYWNEIEKQPGTYNFEMLDWIISAIANTDKKIILAVGMKAPRYPEFHIPEWLKHDNSHTTSETQKLCKAFTTAVLERYKDNKSISYIQIENEPLSNMSITNNRTVDLGFYIAQTIQARLLMRPDQKLLLTNAINIFPYSWGKEYNNAFYTNLALADAVGVNVYTNIGVEGGKYLRPLPFLWWKLKSWHNLGTRRNVEMWITEAQSEPWEHGSAVHVSKPSFPSASPQQSEELVKELTHLGYQNILLWGCEYWYWHKKQGREEWWAKMISLLKSA